jgi:class 3 adenylate cyclase
MPDLPTGTVTFLFTDIEGSTRLLQELGSGYGWLQDQHASIMRKAIADGDGVEIRTEGDSFFVVFPTPSGALRAAVTAQRELASFSWPDDRRMSVRMGLHTGEGIPGGDDYLGIDVKRSEPRSSNSPARRASRSAWSRCSPSWRRKRRSERASTGPDRRHRNYS